jgi:hypothetical protein
MNAPTRDLNAKVFERDPLDWYVEGQCASDALFAVERFSGAIWDPSCGGGNIMEAATRAGYDVVGTDIKRRTNEPWFVGERDFLADGAELAPNIVCNPPFYRAKGAEAFIRQAHKLAAGKIAMFLDIRFLAGADRAGGLYSELTPHRAWIVTPRISCPPGEYLLAGNKAEGGSADWLWLVWDKLAPPPPPGCTQLRWLIGVGK